MPLPDWTFGLAECALKNRMSLTDTLCFRIAVPDRSSAEPHWAVTGCRKRNKENPPRVELDFYLLIEERISAQLTVLAWSVYALGTNASGRQQKCKSFTNCLRRGDTTYKASMLNSFKTD
jgi:hypothetical protein